MSNFLNSYKPGSITSVRQPATVMMKHIGIYGQFGAGKTRTAATRSEFWPGVVPAKETIYLEDMIWITAENALGTLAALNVWPAYVVDVLAMLRPDETNAAKPVARDALQAVNWVIQELEHLKKTTKAKYVVVDTASNFQQLIVAAVFKTNPDPKAGQSNWGIIGNLMSQFVLSLELDYQTIWLLHPDQNMDSLVAMNSKLPNDVLASRESAAVSRGTAHDGSVRPSLSGKAARSAILGSIDVLFWLDVVSEQGKPVRYLRQLGTEDAQGKSRFEGILADKELPNLKAIAAKIEKGVGR